MTTSVLDSRTAWFRLSASLAIATIGGIGMWSIVLVLPLVQAEFGVSRGGASLPYTATMLGFAAGNLLIGRLIDRFGASRVLMGSALVMGAGFALAARADSLLVFALAQGVLIGTGCAAGFGPLLADISHWFMRRRGLAVALVASGNYMAGVIWPLALNGPLALYGWRLIYVAIAFIVVVTIIPLALLLRAAPPAAEFGATLRRNGSPRSSSLSSRQLTLVLCLAGVSCCIAMAMPQVHIVALCSDLGFGAAVGAEMLSLMLAGGIVSRLASGLLADRIGGILTVLLGSLLQTMALVLYLPFDGLVSLYAVSLVFGLSQGGLVPSYAIVVREYLPARDAGRNVGIVMMMTVLGMAIGGWMSGAIYDATGSYQLAFLNGIAWNLVNFAAILFILWRSTGPRALALHPA